MSNIDWTSNNPAPEGLPTLAITSGEPAGIGLDLCVALAQQPREDARLVILADPDMLASRARLLGQSICIRAYQPACSPAKAGELLVLPVPTFDPVIAGKLNPANSQYVLNLLRRAVQGCQRREFAAMVTAPIHKGVINDAGIAFSGHTEWLAHETGTAQVVMMLLGGGLRVALATTHIPLQAVSRHLRADHLTRTVQILHHDLQSKFGLKHPRILVAGLNPHAGEGGHLGHEEIDVIIPVLTALRAQGMQLLGPLPADTLFTPPYLQQADAVLAMYHDQGLPVLKYASFGHGVNLTLGLPILRTSVDHGTALDLAGTGRAQVGSLLAAIELARELSLHHATSVAASLS